VLQKGGGVGTRETAGKHGDENGDGVRRCQGQKEKKRGRQARKKKSINQAKGKNPSNVSDMWVKRSRSPSQELRRSQRAKEKSFQGGINSQRA